MPWIQLSLLIIVSFLLRLYRIANPVLDWHSFRQADTASVTRRYVQEGVNFLYPKYHDLSNIQSGYDNPQGYRMVEFPLMNGIIAWWLRLLPSAELVTTSRFFSIVFSLGTLVSLYWIIKLLFHQTHLALLTAAFWGILPFSVYYSRVILPEPFLLFFSTFSISLFVHFLQNKSMLSWWASLISLAVALLLKPYALFLAPVYLWLIFKYEKKPWFNFKHYLFVILALLPLLAWRKWIQQFPEGIPASNWLFNSDHIRLRPAWFRWIFWERLTKLIGGYLSPLLLFFTLKTKQKEQLGFIISWWTGLIIYMIVIATGNVRHDYYQTLLLPCLCCSLAIGLNTLYEFLLATFSKWHINYHRQLSLGISCLIFIMIPVFSWHKIHGYYNVNHWEYLHAGEAAHSLLPLDAKVIAPAMGDTMFLFQTQRSGWPIGFLIEEKIKAGATHYVTTDFNYEADDLEEKYPVIKKTDEYLILDLTHTKDQP